MFIGDDATPTRTAFASSNRAGRHSIKVGGGRTRGALARASPTVGGARRRLAGLPARASPRIPGLKESQSLTSGGDAPGMNAAMRAVTRSALGAGL